MAVQINDDDDNASIYFDTHEKDTEFILGLDVTTAEIVAAYATKSRTPEDEAEWSLIPNRQIDIADTLISPLSVLSPLSPFTEIDDLISSYQSDEDLSRNPSTPSDVVTEDHSPPVVAAKSPPAEIIVNGKPHKHPLRSHPVTEADCIRLPEELASLFPPRTDSLQSSKTSSKGSISEAVSPRTTRPPFPPRKDSLMSLNSFANAQAERPRTSHVRSPRRDSFFMTTNRSELSVTTPAQKAKLLHRRSASVADLFLSLTNKAANRSQSVAPVVSAPILIHAPPRSPATVAVPPKIQPSLHPRTPYTMQPPFRSHTWNSSQLSAQSSANTSNLSNEVMPTHNISQTSLHSNNANRKAFVMQRPNTSVISLHSQRSTQDLKRMFSGYDTHVDIDMSPEMQTNSPPVPPKHEEFERLDRRGSEIVRIPAPVPVDLKERRFKRVLNLRRANAVRHHYVSFVLFPGFATNLGQIAPVNNCFLFFLMYPASAQIKSKIPCKVTNACKCKRKNTNIALNRPSVRHSTHLNLPIHFRVQAP